MTPQTMMRNPDTARPSLPEAHFANGANIIAEFVDALTAPENVSLFERDGELYLMARPQTSRDTRPLADDA